MQIEKIGKAHSSAYYTTVDGDELDHVCYQYYGTHDNLNMVLAINRDLVKKMEGGLLPAGIKIWLPEIEQTKQTEQVTLW